MTEQSGIARALEALGSEIIKREAQLNLKKALHDDAKKQLAELIKKNDELTEQLKQAEADRDAACRYALKLEKLLEGCKTVYNDLTTGGADECKKS